MRCSETTTDRMENSNCTDQTTKLPLQEKTGQVIPYTQTTGKCSLDRYSSIMRPTRMQFGPVTVAMQFIIMLIPERQTDGQVQERANRHTLS